MSSFALFWIVKVTKIIVMLLLIYYVPVTEKADAAFKIKADNL